MTTTGRTSLRSGSHATSGPPLGPRTSGAAPPGKTTRSSGIPLDDIINDPEVEIKDMQTARTLLDQTYTIHGEPAMPEHISQALFYISQAKNVNNMLWSTIRATAFLVRELAAPALANSITRAVADKLDSSVLIAISPHIGKILAAADNLEKINEKANKNVQLINARITDPTNPTSNAPAHLSINHLEDKVQSLANDYARAHAAIKERQILIELNGDHLLLNNTTKRETSIDLIKQAIDTVDRVDGPGLQLKSIAHLRNNCILLKLNSQESAAWIKDTPCRTTFLEKIGGTATIKDRQYSIVIPFLHVNTDLENPDTLCEMENENNILTGSISRIKWIKDPAKRSPTQKVAHALAFITTPESANRLLRDGLYWGLDRLRPYKDKREPVRCLKCQ
ncbi:hypothetical protein M404DRAFT_949189 [Pisolithus tinctorius Marx 270]|uniref:Uncharacterized protein n=1 Tax=Pisolithus tinctorius Marx 270 TaxID=870435 RepID=A0A0C3PB25_PISTI|nr:hypothetical protein M404DRAFT_949189 [Pisolithus tinctorius Marx 270]